MDYFFEAGIESPLWSSRPREFHLQPLTEPCVNLSIHTALRELSQDDFTAFRSNPPICVVVCTPSGSFTLTPSLQLHYSAFNTTMGQSEFHCGFGTYQPRVLTLVPFP